MEEQMTPAEEPSTALPQDAEQQNEHDESAEAPHMIPENTDGASRAAALIDETAVSNEAVETKESDDTEADAHLPPSDSESAVSDTPDFEALASMDLLALQRSFPETAALQHLSALPNAALFGRLRESGYSVAMAYLLSREESRDIQKKAESGKEHLSSSVKRKGGFSLPESMTYRELSAAKELFRDLTQAELLSLYKRAKRV